MNRIETQEYYKPLLDALYERFTARCGVSRAALRDALNRAGFVSALYHSAPGERVSARGVLALAQPAMRCFAEEPSTGWLPYIYALLADGFFPDARFPRPSEGQAQAAGFFLTVFDWFLAQEAAFLPFDPLSDPIPLSPEERDASAVGAEYSAFVDAVSESHFMALMRIGREIMPFDPASHTIGVHNVAVHTGRMAAKAGLPVDLALVSAAALSHDVGKFGCRGKDAARVPYLHYYYTWQWLSDCGMPTIAHVAANHSTWDLEFENLPIESLLLIYADFRVRGTRDAAGREQVTIQTLAEAYDAIFGKLANMTEEKIARYRTVYCKLRDFERFLCGHGVPTALLCDELTPPPAIDPALLTPAGAADSLRELTFSNNVSLMHTLSTTASFAELLEQARSEKNLQRIRTYLQLFEEYSTYMTRDHKLKTLAFLYELLMHREGDVRRNAGRIMGKLLANSGPRYRKELPEGVHGAAMGPTMMALLQESTDLWDEYVELCLHPDHKISQKHAQRIFNSLKTIAEHLFRNAQGEEARHYLKPLYERLLTAQGDEQFILLDTLSHVPFTLFEEEELRTLLPVLRAALASGETRLCIAALRALEKFAALPALADEALAALGSPAPEGEDAAVTYLRAHVRSALQPGAPEPPCGDISAIYLSNLKNAVHWAVKLVQVDMLATRAAANREDAFHIAMHLSNLLCVSEHLPVREHAGKTLVQIAQYLSVDQCNEIVIDLIRELETGQSEIARFISPCLGRLMCLLPQKELDECLDILESLERSANAQAASAAIRTLSVILYTVAIAGGESFDPQSARRILGLLLTGIAHYDPNVHTVALGSLCRDFFSNEYVPLAVRRKCFPAIAKKLRTLLAEPREGRLVFFNQAAMLNHLYRFMTASEVRFGAFDFPKLPPVAFFPGTFDPFSSGHKRIVDEIRARGFEVYLAVDEFSWSKRTLARLLRRQIANMSVADCEDVFLFPDDTPVNIAVPKDLAKLSALFPARELYLVAGSDVIRNASAYKSAERGSAADYNHIIFAREEDAPADGGDIASTIRGKLIRLSLPAYYEGVSSSRIREYIDKNLDISMLLDPIVQEFIYSHGLYLRSPQLKNLLAPHGVSFETWLEGAPATGYAPFDAAAASAGRHARGVLLHRRGEDAPAGFALGRTLHVSELFSALNDRDAAEAVRGQVSGRLLLIDAVSAPEGEGELALLLVTELLARALSSDHTYALCRCAQADPLRETLAQLGFLPTPGQQELLSVDMRAPLVLVQDALERIKPPLQNDPAVQAAVLRTRPALRRAIAAMFPGVLLLCFNTELLNQALMRKVRRANGVSGYGPSDGLGKSMCVPYGKVLSGEIVPNTVTKTLHADKVFDEKLDSFRITEYPGYSSLVNQARTLCSFRRPVLLVDDLLHNGYRLEKLDPLFRAEGVKVSRIIVGVLSGRGRDLMELQNRKVESEYFIPNLRYWFTESLQYPFLGGDSLEAGKREAGLVPSINLILPYTWPRYLHGVADAALRAFSRVSLENAQAILAVLEQRHQAMFSTALTLKRLAEALYRPRLPYKGAHLHYDLNAAASACVADDIALFERLSRMEDSL